MTTLRPTSTTARRATGMIAIQRVAAVANGDGDVMGIEPLYRV